MPNYFTYYDLLLIPLNLFLIFLLCLFFSRKYKQTDIYRFFWIGLFLRLTGGIFLYLYQRYIFVGGDMFQYYQGIVEYHQAMLEHPLEWLQSLFQIGSEYSENLQRICANEIHYTPEEALTVKVGSLIGITGLDSFTSIGFWFSLFSYFGSWRLFLVFRDKYPSIGKSLAIPFLFIPSCFFWGTTISKDAITLGAFGIFFNSFYFIFFKGRFTLSNCLWLIFSIYLVGVIKGYILILFFPALFFLVFINFLNRIQSKLLKLLVLPLTFLVFVYAANTLLDYLSTSETFNQYVNDQATEKIKGQYEYLAKQAYARSSYDLGDFEPTVSGIASVIPKAINISLYRPYISEINSPALLLAALESLIALLLTLFVMFKTGLFRFFKLLFTDSYLVFCLIFTLFFASIVGITSGNFGSLMRYKIPLMPYYFTILTVIYFSNKAGKRLLNETNTMQE